MSKYEFINKQTGEILTLKGMLEEQLNGGDPSNSLNTMKDLKSLFMLKRGSAPLLDARGQALRAVLAIFTNYSNFSSQFFVYFNYSFFPKTL